jgi:hypothetical protein
MCSLAATLAEDFFRAGRLVAVSFDDEAPLPVRRAQDLENFMDRLAVVKPSLISRLNPVDGPVQHRQNLLTFAPDGARGVTAYINGEKAATA